MAWLAEASLGENCRQWNRQVPNWVAQKTVLGFARSVIRVHPRPARVGVYYPYASNAEGQVIVDPLLSSSNAIIRRENLNGDFRWRGDDSSRWLSATHDRHIRDAEAIGLNLHPDFDPCPEIGKMSTGIDSQR